MQFLWHSFIWWKVKGLRRVRYPGLDLVSSKAVMKILTDSSLYFISYEYKKRLPLLNEGENGDKSNENLKVHNYQLISIILEIERIFNNIKSTQIVNNVKWSRGVFLLGSDWWMTNFHSLNSSIGPIYFLPHEARTSWDS